MSSCCFRPFGLFIRLPASVSASTTGLISMQFGIGDFCVNLVRKVKFGKKSGKNSGPLREDTSTFHCCRRNFVATKAFSSLLGTITHTPVYSIGVAHPCSGLRLCTGSTAHRSTGITQLFLYHDTRRGEGSASRPGRSLPPGKTRYPSYKRLGGSQGRSRQVRKISPPPGLDPRTVQPVTSRYTD